MTTTQWIGTLIVSGVAGWWIEHRRWAKPGKRHAVYVRSRELAGDRVFLASLEALIDRAWEARNTDSGQDA